MSLNEADPDVTKQNLPPKNKKKNVKKLRNNPLPKNEVILRNLRLLSDTII